MSVRVMWSWCLVPVACALLAARPGADPQGVRAAETADLHTTWSDYGGGSDASQYSALKQITRTNVAALRVAWTYPTGDAANYLFDPIVVDDVMYVLAKDNAIVALDAATGKPIWVHSCTQIG